MHFTLYDCGDQRTPSGRIFGYKNRKEKNHIVKSIYSSLRSESITTFKNTLWVITIINNNKLAHV